MVQDVIQMSNTNEPTKQRKSGPKGGRPKGAGKKNVGSTEIRQLEKLSGLGLTVEQIAHTLGMSKKTLERRVKEEPEVSDALKRGRAVAIQQVSQRAFSMAMSGKIPSMTMFWLKCQAGWKETKAIELSGKDGAPLFNNDQIKNMAQAILEDDDDSFESQPDGSSEQD